MSNCPYQSSHVTLWSSHTNVPHTPNCMGLGTTEQGEETVLLRVPCRWITHPENKPIIYGDWIGPHERRSYSVLIDSYMPFIIK